MASLNVDIDDFSDELDDSEKADLPDLLEEDGFFVGKNILDPYGIIPSDSFDQHILRQNLIKLLNVYHSISSEDLATITQITNKY